jgi:hypothetical protein
MNKKFLTNSLKAIIGLASIVFLHSYIHNITDTTLPENLKNSDNKVQILENKINNIKIEELQNEIIKNKLELLKINLEECNQNSNREIGLLKSMDKTSIDSQNKIEYHTNNFITENEKTQNLIEDFISLFIDKNKFIGNNFPDIDLLINKWNNLISNLSIEQLGAFAHLLSALTIFFCLSTIISIVYSDFLLKYLKIEEKYPKLTKILKIRKMFQHYYLLLNFIFIITILLGIVIVNFKILIL